VLPRGESTAHFLKEPATMAPACPITSISRGDFNENHPLPENLDDPGVDGVDLAGKPFTERIFPVSLVIIEQRGGGLVVNSPKASVIVSSLSSSRWIRAVPHLSTSRRTLGRELELHVIHRPQPVAVRRPHSRSNQVLLVDLRGERRNGSSFRQAPSVHPSSASACGIRSAEIRREWNPFPRIGSARRANFTDLPMTNLVGDQSARIQNAWPSFQSSVPFLTAPPAWSPVDIWGIERRGQLALAGCPSPLRGAPEG